MTEQFRKHIRRLERRACAGDVNAVRSLACMALLLEGPPDDRKTAPVIEFAPYLRLFKKAA